MTLMRSPKTATKRQYQDEAVRQFGISSENSAEFGATASGLRGQTGVARVGQGIPKRKTCTDSCNCALVVKSGMGFEPGARRKVREF